MRDKYVNDKGEVMHWDDSYTDLDIELEMIRRGHNTFDHMMSARSILWPKRYRHRWTDMMYKHTIENIVTILMGPGSSQKSSFAAEYSLIRYWANPNDTLILVS